MSREKGGRSRCECSRRRVTDNGEILRRWYGPEAARSRAREERERRNGEGRDSSMAERCKGGKESSKRGSGSRGTDSSAANGGCNSGKGSNSGGTGRSERFIESSMV